jgi:signal peptidase I
LSGLGGPEGVHPAPDDVPGAPGDEAMAGGPGPGATGPGDDIMAPPRPSNRSDRRRAVREWVLVVVVGLLAALLVRTFVVEMFWIPSGSMEPTLKPGDRVMVYKLTSHYSTGDIIVFRRPPHDLSSDKDLIKRVIAGPGQTVRVANCAVYVNGRELTQPYLPKGWQDPGSPYCTQWASGPGTANLPNPYKVPLGYYFVMGDNRTNSYDSRYWGPLPASYIVGQAFVRLWPPSRLGWL